MMFYFSINITVMLITAFNMRRNSQKLEINKLASWLFTTLVISDILQLVTQGVILALIIYLDSEIQPEIEAAGKDCDV